MRIYRPGARGRQIVHACPGHEYPNSDFVDANGTPIQFKVEFIEGVADVPSNLGEYMISIDGAQRHPFVLPKPLKLIETKVLGRKIA